MRPYMRTDYVAKASATKQSCKPFKKTRLGGFGGAPRHIVAQRGRGQLLRPALKTSPLRPRANPEPRGRRIDKVEPTPRQHALPCGRPGVLALGLACGCAGHVGRRADHLVGFLVGCFVSFLASFPHAAWR